MDPEMDLDPKMYKCKLHDKDLTHEVKQQLQSMTLTTTYGPLLLGRRRKRWQSFAVIVDCPGADKEGHKLVFEGKVWVED